MKKTTFGMKKIQGNYRDNKSSRPQSLGGKIHKKSTKKSIISKIFGGGFLSFRRVLGAFLILFVLGVLFIWGVFLRDTPDVKNVKNPDFYRESTVFYDKFGNEFYRFGENGKRIYIPYSEISDSIKNAVVSAEDGGFFENPGVDVFGLFRAGINYIIGKNEQVKGTSTISQQLIKNTLLTNERSLSRKIKEAYLAYQLNREYSKEKILEMYLNAIEFGHGANGVEQASLTFFGKSAKDVGPLGATILASLPKSPTAFSPYSHRGRLMGKVEAYPTRNPKDRITLSLEAANSTYAPVYDVFKEYIKNLTFTHKGNNSVEICHLKKEYSGDPKYSPDNSGCLTVNFDELLHVIGGIQVVGDLKVGDDAIDKYTIEYTVGRKDYVATQMLKDKKLTGKVFGDILYNGLEFQFQRVRHSIKYPYFVMYIKEQLEAKYGKDINIKDGLRVYTTLDPKLQTKAEEIIREQAESNAKKFDAKSAALISMDNTSGELLAMVGGPDYFDEKNGGNNNMTTASRQPGSSFKPLVYALAISRHPIGPESPIADVKTAFGSYRPNNYDREFKGLMSVGRALGYSRNIPAVKMYFLAGQEKEIGDFAKKIGINTLKGDDGAALALGAGEVKPIEIMQAYSVLANNGMKRPLFAIKRIEDSQGGVIEEVRESQAQEVFSPAASYIVSKILSENNNRPESPYWRNQLTIKGKTTAAKTGTANKPAKKGTSIKLPGDTWTVGYSPSITTVVWAGNVDGSPLKGNCDGINCAAPAWNKFMTYALGDLPNVEFKEPSSILKYKTSKLTGLLSDNGSTDIMAVALTQRDSGNRKVIIDELCGGPVTPETPEESIAKIQVPTGKPIIDGFDPSWLKGYYEAVGSAVIGEGTGILDKACERPKKAGNVNISTKIIGINNNILEVSWNGNRAIKKFRVTIDGKVAKEITYDTPSEGASDRITTNNMTSDSNIRIDVVDIYGYRYSYQGKGVDSIQKDDDSNEKTPKEPTLPSIEEEQKNIDPSISITNPPRGSISIYAGDLFNLRFNVQTGTNQKDITVKIDNSVYKKASSGNVFVIPILTEGLSVGNHSVSIDVVDKNKKTAQQDFTLTILSR